MLLTLADMPRLGGTLLHNPALPSLTILRWYNTSVGGTLPASWGDVDALPALRVLTLQVGRPLALTWC